MASIYTELALFGSKNEYARTETVFPPMSEVCDGMVSLIDMASAKFDINDTKKKYVFAYF